MGMDTVELVIRFEDTFAISISDEVAVELTTPGKATDCILSQLQVSSQSSCMSQQAFYFLRKQFVTVLGIPRGEFRPAYSLTKIIPLEHRRENWLKMEQELGPLSLPALARPVWLFRSLTLLSTLSFLIAGVYSWNHDAGVLLSFLFASLAAAVFGYLGAASTRPLQRNFRKGYELPGDLAKFLVAYNPTCFKKDWTRDQVAEMVRAIIIEQTGVRDFSEDSHFINDMHLD